MFWTFVGALIFVFFVIPLMWRLLVTFGILTFTSKGFRNFLGISLLFSLLVFGLIMTTIEEGFLQYSNWLLLGLPMFIWAGVYLKMNPEE